jgi:hypothetical protein
VRGTFSPEDVRKIFIAADTSGRGNVTSQDWVDFFLVSGHVALHCIISTKDLRHLLQSGAEAVGGVMSDEAIFS